MSVASSSANTGVVEVAPDAQALPVYLINLDRNPDRLEFMRRQLDDRAIRFTRLPASDGRDPAVVQRSRRSSLCHLGPGAIGCYESHIRVWEQFLSTKAQACIVLEDDVLLSSDFMQSASVAAASVKFDLIKLDFFARRVLVEPKGIAVSSARSVYRFRGKDWCAGGYVLSREGAKRLLAASKGYTRPVDNVMYDGESMFVLRSRIYSLIPASCVQTGHLRQEGDLPDFTTNIVDRTILPDGALQRALFRIRSMVRLETGPLQRLVRRVVLARVARAHGVAEVENSFVASPLS
jgi:glycosyl transferase family 25